MHADMVHHSPDRVEVSMDRVSVAMMVMHLRAGTGFDTSSAVVGAPYARQVRAGQVEQIDVLLEQRVA
jgi:hypothetical protein